MSLKSPIRVVVADDHVVVRDGVRRLLDDFEDLAVVGAASSGTSALDVVSKQPVDVLVLDVSMPGPGFLETLRRARSRHPDLAIVVLSMHLDSVYAVRALRAGASGYVEKSQPTETLVEAIRGAHAGQRYISPVAAEQMLARMDDDTDCAPHELLSEREYQVLCQLGNGMTVSEAAEALSLSAKTVSTYRARLLKKLDLSKTAHLVRYVIEHDLNA